MKSKHHPRFDHSSFVVRHSSSLACAGLAVALAYGLTAPAARAAEGPYKVIKGTQTPGSGGIDYVTADSEGRRLYVPRGGQILVFDLDSLSPAGAITNAQAHGVAVDPVSHHGFCSSSPVVMWDTKTLETIKTIPVQGRPDGIVFEPFTERVYVLSHAEPNVTVLDGKDGSVVGTIDLGGQPEQAASDNAGKLYVDLEDKDQVAVVDVKAMKVTAHYDLSEKARTPAGLGLDAKNHILFAFCRQPSTAVILSADDGKIITSLPIGQGTDGGGFNPDTLEAFSSQRDGTLTIIKESSPTKFEVAQTVQTKTGGKTCTLDTKTGHIVVIATEPVPAAQGATQPSPTPTPDQSDGKKGRGGRGGGRGGPNILDVVVVGR